MQLVMRKSSKPKRCLAFRAREGVGVVSVSRFSFRKKNRDWAGLDHLQPDLQLRLLMVAVATG